MMPPKRRLGPLGLLALTVSISFVGGGQGCRRLPRSEARAVIATVDNAPIYVDMWAREVKRARSENLDTQGAVALPTTGLLDHGKQVLEDLIVRRLLVCAADAEQVTVSQDEIEAGYAHLQDGWPQAMYSEVVAHEDFSVSELRGLVKETLLIRKYMRDFVFARLAITDAQIETYAARHPEVLSRPESIRLRQIVVKTQSDAASLVESLRRGKVFSELAEAQSVAPEAKRGGDLGVLPRGVLPESFERVVFSLPIRTLSPIIPGPEGYHLFWVTEHALGRSYPLSQMRNEVQNVLRRQAEAEAQSAHIAALKQAAQITIKESYLADESA